MVSSLRCLLQGVKDLKQQRNVSFARGLQVNVDAAYGGGGDKVHFANTWCMIIAGVQLPPGSRCHRCAFSNAVQ